MKKLSIILMFFILTSVVACNVKKSEEVVFEEVSEEVVFEEAIEEAESEDVVEEAVN